MNLVKASRPIVMRLRDVRKRAREVCRDNKVKLLLNWWQSPPDYGAYADNTIWIGKCSDPYLFCVIFCHELGHWLDDSEGVWKNEWAGGNKVSTELSAWARMPKLMLDIFGVKADDSANKFIGENISSYFYPGRLLNP